MESINEGMVFTNQLPAYASYKIGDWTYGTPRIWEWEFSSRLEIGKFCSIADGANIMLGGEHRVDWEMVKIKDNWSLLLANDIQEFIGRHTE